MVVTSNYEEKLSTQQARNRRDVFNSLLLRNAISHYVRISLRSLHFLQMHFRSWHTKIFLFISSHLRICRTSPTTTSKVQTTRILHQRRSFPMTNAYCSTYPILHDLKICLGCVKEPICSKELRKSCYA